MCVHRIALAAQFQDTGSVSPLTCASSPPPPTHTHTVTFTALQSTTRVKPFICTMPMRLDEGWNQVQFNLADFVKRAYGTNYVETLRVQVHANCRIRRIYFADRLYSEAELPPEFKVRLGVGEMRGRWGRGWVRREVCGSARQQSLQVSCQLWEGGSFVQILRRRVRLCADQLLPTYLPTCSCSFPSRRSSSSSRTRLRQWQHLSSSTNAALTQQTILGQRQDRQDRQAGRQAGQHLMHSAAAALAAHTAE